MKIIILLSLILVSCNKLSQQKVDSSLACQNFALNLFDHYEGAHKKLEIIGQAFDSIPKEAANNDKNMKKLGDAVGKQTDLLKEVSTIHLFSKSTDDKVRTFLNSDEKYMNAHREEIAKLMESDAKIFFQKCDSLYQERANRCSKYDEFSAEFKNCQEKFNEDSSELTYEFEFYRKAKKLEDASKELEKLKAELLLDSMKNIKTK